MAAQTPTEAMEAILRQLQSNNNAARGEAEAAFNTAKAQASPCLAALTDLSTASQDEVIRATASVLLRRSAMELWPNASPAVQAHLKQRLPAALRTEPRPNLRKKLADTIAVVYSGLDPPAGQWPELVPAMFELARGRGAGERESALYVFSQLLDYLGEGMQMYAGELHAVLEKGMGDEDLMAQVAALRATCSVLSSFEGSVIGPFEALVPVMLKPVSAALNKDEEDQARNCIELLIEVIEAEPRFWRKHLQEVAHAMLTVATTTTLEDATRQLGLEFIVTAAEKLPGPCRKIPNFVESVIPVALGMMLEVEDDPEWYTKEDDDDDADDYTNFDAGQESLDRFALALGGKIVLPVAFAIIPGFLQNKDSWNHRHAGVLAISQIGEGCMKQIEEQLSSVVNMVLQSFGDPHPRVRWGAINCIGQMCTDFGPKIQKENHAAIVPALIQSMEDSTCIRVQSHAAAAIINFCDEATPDIISPYLEPLLSRLMALLQSNSRLIQEQAVTAVAAVSDAAGTHFVPFYDSFMPLLKKVLTVTVGRKDLRRLRGKVMECISLVGLSVGKEKFSADAATVMDVLVRTQAQRMEEDDPQAFYLMQAYARICRCLKEEFIPYLPFVMPGLIDAASHQPEIEVMDALEDDDDDATDGMETFQIGGKRFGVRTSALEDKVTAVSMIACFVNELQGGFLPYVEKTTGLMVPLLKFFYHEDCRSSAAQCLPDLVRCISSQGPSANEQVASFVKFVVPTLIESMQSEPDIEVLVVMVDSLSELINRATPGVLDVTLQKSISDAVLSICAERAERISERKAEAEEDGWDEEELEEAEADGEKDNELLDRVGDLIGACIRTHAKFGFFNIFEAPNENGTSLVQMSGNYLLPQNTPTERRVAICIFGDAIEYGDAQGAMYLDRVLPAMLAYCTDADADIRQAAAYGIGVSAEKCGGLFLQSGGDTSPGPLGAVISAPDSRSEENEMATDNAVSALMKIVEYQPNCLSPEDSRSAKLSFLSYLPMRGDEAEARICHGKLIRLASSGDADVLSPDGLNRFFGVLADVLGTPLLADEDIPAAVDLCKRLQTEAPEKVQAALGSLNEAQKMKLAAALS